MPATTLLWEHLADALLTWALWLLVIGSIAAMIAAGAFLAFTIPSCGYTPRWITLTLFGSMIAAALGSMTASVIA